MLRWLARLLTLESATSVVANEVILSFSMAASSEILRFLGGTGI